jgi:hypothetical protein
MTAPVYTVDELIEIIRTQPDPDIREMAARLIYTTGQRDQVSKSILRDLNLPAAVIQ